MWGATRLLRIAARGLLDGRSHALRSRRSQFVRAISSGTFPSRQWFNFWDGEAVRAVEDIKLDDSLDSAWTISQQQLQNLWLDHDPERTGVVSKEKAGTLVKRILDEQRKAISNVIAEENHTKEDLLNGISSWIPRWKQWGVTIEVKDQENKISIAQKLLESLRDESVANAVLEALRPNADGNITHFNFMSALQSGEIRNAELDAMKEKAMEQDTIADFADAAEPAVAAEAHAAEEAAKAARAAAEVAAQAAEIAAQAEMEARIAMEKANEISKLAHPEREESNGEREGSSEAGDEELDYMDLLASLDLMDYAALL